MDLYQLDLSPPNSVDEAKQLLVTARKHLYQAAKQHKELRIQHLSVLLKKRTSSTDAADKLCLHRIKQIQNTEATRSVFAKIRYQRTSQHRQPINQLQVPLDPSDVPKDIACHDNKWTVLESPTDIVAALIARNIQHFGQAQGTPFTQTPLNTFG